MFCSAELWAENDYKSCSLPAVDDDDTQDDSDADAAAAAGDDGDVDDDDVKMTDINYVIGNVLQPQNSDNRDAVIVHCVGN